MASTRCQSWEKRFAQVGNLWLLRAAMTPLSGSEFRVLLYYVARTWGDFDARRGRAGRPWVRIPSREVAGELGLTDSGVRRATKHLVERRLLRRFHAHRGRLPAALGPEPLLVQSLAESPAGEGQVPAPPPLDAILDTLSPQLRSAVESGREKWQA